MAKKKKNKLLSGYYDASASKNVTDANIEENENGWKIVKNKSTVSRLPNKVSSNTESQNNNVQKLKNKREELSNNPFKQTTINLPQIAPVNKQNSTNNIKESLNAAVKSKLTKDAFQENLNNEIRKNAITSKKEKKETQTKVDLEKINRPLYAEPKKETGLLENATKSSLNFLTRLGKGIALDFPEQILESGLQIGSSKRNPIMHLTNKEKDFGERLKDAGKSMLANAVDISPVGWIDKLVQKVNPSIDDDTISEKLLNSIDDKGIKNRQKMAEEIIKKDASQSFMDNQLGYGKKLSNGKTIQETLDEGALIKSDNTGGKIAENIGQMLPSLMTGGQVQSLTTMGISSFGSGMEEAYNNGATREEATKYGLLNSAIEIGTEKMFAGVGGVFGKGALDDVVKTGIQNRIKSELGKQLVDLGIDVLGEGTEELMSDVLNPLAQKLTYASEEDFKKLYEDQNFAEDFVMGALSSLVLKGASIPAQKSMDNKIKNEIKKTINEDNSYEIMKNLQEQGYTQEQSIQLVNKALKEIGQPQISIENIVQNETTQQTNTNTPQISQEIGQNQELSNKITNNLQTQKVSEIEQYKSKTFDRDYKKFESGKYTDNDNLILLDSTPEYFYNLGYDTNKPIVVSMDKLNTIMKEEKLTTEDGKHQHGITKEIIEQLPYAISNPLNVIKNPKFDNRFVIVTELSDKYGDIIIVPIEMNTKGHIENVLQDVNRVVSTYGKEQYDGNDDLTKKGYMDLNNDNVVYDIDNDIKKRVTHSRVQFPKGNNSKGDINPRLQLPNVNNSLTDNDDTIKPKKSQIAPISSQYSMQQNRKNDTKAPIVRENNEINESIKDDVIKVKPSKESISLAKTINEAIKQDIIVEKGKETKQRRWIDTSLQSDAVEGKILLEDLDPKKTTYVVQSNKKSLDKANNKLNQMGYEESVEYVKSKINDSKVSLTDVVLAQRLIQEAIQRGDTTTASDLIMDTAILGTDLGQKVQALSMIQRLTPEGQLKMFQKIVKRAKIIGDKSYDNVEITPEMVELILGAYNSDGTFDQTNLNNRVEQFKQKVAEQMKTTTGEKIVAWRYLSMLGNPKTHIRNVVSNVAMYGTLKVKNAMARTIETVTIPMNSRTKTWKKASDTVKEFAKTTTNEMKDIISGEGKYSEKTSLETKKKTFNNKALEGVSNFNSNMLSAEDWFFSKRAFESTLREYLTAQGIKTDEDIQNNPELIEKAKQYAVEQAEIATFRQYSKIASAISKFERKHKVAGLAVSATIPFKKTPVNIAKTGVKYSPIGLIKSATYDAYRLKIGEINASQFVDNLSQGLTGTSLTLIGYVLAKAGILKGAGDDDKEGKFDSYLGKQTYSINIGGQSFSISWLSPVAMPLLVGANAYEQLEEQKEWDMNIVVDTLAQTLDPLSEMSFISGLTDTLNSYQSSPTKMISSVGTSMVQNYVSQFFPTLLSQMAATFDDTKRTTKASNNSKFKEGEETVRMLMYKVPGLRNLLEPSTDIWGNEIKQSENVVQRAFENFIAPYSRKEDITTKLDKELKRVYQEIGESSVIPGVPYAYTQYDKVKYQMSAKEYTQYKKTYGETANEILNLLIKEKNYKDSPDTRKARMIEKAFKYATELSKAEFLEGRDIEFDEDDFKSNSMSYSEMCNYIIRNTRYLDGEK